MLFKKPYGFLIKHFKLIHLVVGLLFCFVFSSSINLYRFLNEYVKNNYTLNTTDSLSSVYIPFILLLAVIILIIIFILISLLFRSKKKPSRFYEFTSIFLIIILVLLIYFKTVLTGMESTLLESQISRIYRDISLMLLFPQLFIIVVSFTRALGFNIKKFEFQKDFKDLQITSDDVADVEINFEIEDYKIKRNIRRFIREFIYYIKENKFILVIISIILIIVFAYLIYNGSNYKYDNNYNENEVVYVSSVSINVLESMITNLSYNGNIIDDNYYLVLKLLISNDTKYNGEFNINNVKLKIGDNYYTPSLEVSNHFLDYGLELNKKVIERNTNLVVAIPYKINKKDLNNKYKLSIYNNSVTSKDGVIDAYNYINLKPKLIENVEVSHKTRPKIEFNLKDSNMGNTSIKINDFILTDEYKYDYQVCVTKEDCRTFKDVVRANKDKTLLVLNANYNIDKESIFAKKGTEFSLFCEYYLKILLGNETKINIVNVTPQLLKNNVVLEISEEIYDYYDRYLLFTIRNKSYQVEININSLK